MMNLSGPWRDSVLFYVMVLAVVQKTKKRTAEERTQNEMCTADLWFSSVSTLRCQSINHPERKAGLHTKPGAMTRKTLHTPFHTNTVHTNTVHTHTGLLGKVCSKIKWVM